MKRRNEEAGSALIPVLCLIFSASLLVTAMLAISQYDAYTSASQAELQRSVYTLEGVANRVQWLLSAEQQQPAVNFMSFDYSSYAYDRYLPDGKIHTIDYYGTPISFTIHDTAGGLDMGTNYRATLTNLKQNRITEQEFTELVDRVSARITDYRDSDDNIQTDGMEITEYEQLMMEPLPRNSAMLFREELFYIDEFTELFPPDRHGRLSSIRLIPPPNVVSTTRQQQQQQGGNNNQQQQQQQRTLAGNPSIFNAPELYFKSVFALDDSEIASVKNALLLYRTEDVPLSDAIDDTLRAKLMNQNLLRWDASGIYTVIIEPPEGEKRVSQRLLFSVSAAPISGEADSVVKYLEWMFF